MFELDHLQILAREIGARLSAPDKKQLRYNDIVRVARLFYNDPTEGVRELVLFCDRSIDVFYVPKSPCGKF